LCRLSWNLGASASWNPQGLSRSVMGLLYLFYLLTHCDILRFLCSIIPCYKQLFQVLSNIAKRGLFLSLTHYIVVIYPDDGGNFGWNMSRLW